MSRRTVPAAPGAPEGPAVRALAANVGFRAHALWYSFVKMNS